MLNSWGRASYDVSMNSTNQEKAETPPEQSPFIWHELVTADQPRSGAFFSQLFGWSRKEVDAGPFGIYTLFQKNGQDVAGMMNPTAETPGKESFWHFYIGVTDIEACARQAPLLGGAVTVPPHDVPGVGRICIVADPTGAIAHLMQPDKK